MEFNRDETDFIETALNSFFHEAAKKLEKPRELGTIELQNFEEQKRKSQELMTKIKQHGK